MRPAAILCLLVLAGLLVAPGVAMAAEPGVIVDPDSPSGKEYALPLETARREAAADPAFLGRKLSPTAQTAPPFGVGIEPRGGAGGSGSDGGAGTSSAESRTASTAAAGVVTGDFSTSLTIFALSLIVLAGGSLVGFAVGRNSRRDAGA